MIFTTLTKIELLKEYQKTFKMIERSMKAREKASDWRYKTGYTYDLFKELENFDITKASRNELIKAMTGLEKIMKGDYTLKATKERIKKENENFLKNNTDVMKKLLEKEGKKVSERNIKKKAKEFTDSQDYYNFLHSDTYKKLTEHYKVSSDDLIQDYLMNQENALEYYDDYLKGIEENEDEVFELSELLLDNPFED